MRNRDNSKTRHLSDYAQMKERKKLYRLKSLNLKKFHTDGIKNAIFLADLNHPSLQRIFVDLL